MSLQEYYTAINELLAAHDMFIMFCVAKKLYQMDWSVIEAAQTFIKTRKKHQQILAGL